MPESAAGGRETAVRATTVAVALSIVALLCFVPPSTNDLWLQQAIGRIIWTTRQIPRTALFPFTEAAQFPFEAHEWLSSVALHLLGVALGHDRLIWVKGLLGLALFGLLWRLSYRLSRSLFASVLVSVAAMATANYRFYLRPELFALIFAVGILSLLVEYKATGGRRYLLACGPVALLWANCHGSFPVAVVLALGFAAGAAMEARTAPPGGRLRAAVRESTPYLACAAGLALVTLLNPYGVGLYRFAWDLQTSTFVRSYIYEWMPTLEGAFVGSRGFWAFLAFLAFSAAVLALGRKDIPAAGAVLFAAFGGLALDTQRHIVFFAIVAVYPLSAAIRGPAARLEAAPAARAAVLALLLAGAAALLRYGNLYGGFPYSVASDDFSPELIAFLGRPAVRGNVLNSYVLGSELIYRYYPRLRPAIDSRVALYGGDYFLRLLELNTDEGALKRFIARYGVAYILLRWPDFNVGIGHMTNLRKDGWRIVFVDRKVVLLGRPGVASRR